MNIQFYLFKFVIYIILLDAFLPRPDNLLVNLKECKELVKDLLQQLPHRYADTHDPGSAMGAALQVAYKLMVIFDFFLIYY